MIVQILGAFDLITAALLYFGKFPGPGFIASLCILILIIKGVMSFYPAPIYLPGILMNITDVVTVILLYFGTTPLPQLKTTIMVVLLIKSIPSLISGIFLIAGLFGARRD